MARRDEMLRNAVESKLVPVYMTTYEQVKDYYQDKHGQRGWIGALAQSLSGSDARSGKPYLAARRSIERYEAGQFKSMKNYGGKIPDVGKHLPPIGKTLPGNTLTLTVKGEQKEGKGTRDRNISVTFTGPAAAGFVDNPQYIDIWEAYGVDADLFEDGDYAIDVYSVA